MATYASKLRPSAVDGQTIRVLPDGRIRGNAGMEPFSAGTSGGAPATFYVDGNVVSSGNGLGWLSAFKTLSEGLVAAHAYMSTGGNRAWAHRATVYCCGDNLDEDLVLGAEKSDVIGVGTSGSFDRCILIGNHAPRTTTTQGMRLYNMHFDSDTVGILWSLTAISSGIKFLGCTFGGRDAAQTSAILGTACTWIEVSNCMWETSEDNFVTASISIAAGAAVGLNIHNNFIKGSIGILINGSATAVGGSLLIDHNVLHVANETITDSSSLAIVTNNQLITLASTGTTTDGYTGNLALWSNNLLTGSGKTDQIPFISETE